MDYQTPNTATVPEKIRMSPRDFFLHLGIIVSLYVSIVSLVALLFQVIDYTVGDNLNYFYDFYSSGLRAAIASLVIFFPVYLLLGWLFQREVRSVPEKRSLGIRRWLVYLTLFIAGLTIIIDLVVLLNNFLGGEISTSFFLKVFAVLVVAGLVFAYYILDLRRGAEYRGRLYKIFATIAGVLVVASLVGAFVIVGSPMSQRAKRFDQARVNDLQQLQTAVIEQWRRDNNRLPGTLAELNNSVYPGYQVPRDPVTAAQYEYRVVSPTSFELCAVFGRSNKEDFARAQDRNIRDSYPYNTGEWVHDAGRTCFTRTINPTDYQSFIKPMPLRD